MLHRLAVMLGFLLGANACLTSGPVGPRVETAIRVAPYTLEMEKCYQAAEKALTAKVEKTKIQADYDVCAEKADTTYGRTK